ncbi:hypothetical protein CAPTEDRAFT_204354 [Capitella teleta]|uniref:Uncharacterized protein n=1 Tax=Capitella teleta TaxID=283909 RepID=R7VAX6_CAPTE|nr:hypothetical protein CAPTEDRAFT_204354 [Capitella teleta]|eukprot:ELU15754.1 hypothetical protein CAPTEDRAFT_204354 [Capitella teleta]
MALVIIPRAMAPLSDSFADMLPVSILQSHRGEGLGKRIRTRVINEAATKIKAANEVLEMEQLRNDNIREPVQMMADTIFRQMCSLITHHPRLSDRACTGLLPSLERQSAILIGQQTRMQLADNGGLAFSPTSGCTAEQRLLKVDLPQWASTLVGNNSSADDKLCLHKVANLIEDLLIHNVTNLLVKLIY